MFEKDMLSEEKEKIIEIINRYYSKGKMNIQEKIRQVCHNEQLESEVTKINQEIRNLFSEYAIIDWTDEDSCCYEQHILLHERQEILDDDIELIMSLGGKREDLRIFFSVIDKFYYCFLERTEYNSLNNIWDFYTINKYSPKQEQLVKRLDDFMHMRKWIKISDSVARTKVPSIETELKYAGEATIFNCLFSDEVDLKK